MSLPDDIYQSKVFQCDCREPGHYLHVVKSDWDNYMELYLVAPRNSFWKRLKQFFLRQDIVISDIMLEEKEIKELIEFLSTPLYKG